MEMNKKYDVYVVGMRKEYVIGSEPDNDYDMSVKECNDVQYVLFCVSAEGRRQFTITLKTDHGWCGSGWTTASWGTIYINDIFSKFGPSTHRPKNGRRIKIEGCTYDLKNGIHFEDFSEDEKDLDGDPLEYPFILGDKDIANNVFVYASDGGDLYYPMGGVEVNEELFEELPRAFDRRPVWIFAGDSASGKSTLGSHLAENYKVYETDSANNGCLPKEIWADIIVVGNKWKDITPELVKEHLPEGCIPIDVNFRR